MSLSDVSLVVLGPGVTGCDTASTQFSSLCYGPHCRTDGVGGGKRWNLPPPPHAPIHMCWDVVCAQRGDVSFDELTLTAALWREGPPVRGLLPRLPHFFTSLCLPMLPTAPRFSDMQMCSEVGLLKRYYSYRVAKKAYAATIRTELRPLLRLFYITA
jgi:hypothetical protein